MIYIFQSKLCVSLCCPHGEELKFSEEGSRCGKKIMPDNVNYTLETYTKNGQLERSLKQHEDFNVVHFPVIGKLKHSRRSEESYEKIDHLQPGTFCVDPVDYSLRVVEIAKDEDSFKKVFFVAIAFIIFLTTCLVILVIYLFKSRNKAGRRNTSHLDNLNMQYMLVS